MTSARRALDLNIAFAIREAGPWANAFPRGCRSLGSFFLKVLLGYSTVIVAFGSRMFCCLLLLTGADFDLIGVDKIAFSVQTVEM